MKLSLRSPLRRLFRQTIRSIVSGLPKEWRFRLFRRMVECDPAPDSRLVLKIAETEAELEACFALLHDAYVSAGFMRPDPSGLRVTPYHALPTTTTLCAKFDGRVVGTVTLIRDGVFGFPMQTAFDLTAVRQRSGKIAEVSALAVAPEFRRTGGWILFPLMKFMYEYAARYFDTRHLVIAVNPDKIELYESLLFFERLQAEEVDRYDFANGAPAVGAVLDIERAYDQFKRIYSPCTDRRNLFRYFVETRLPNIQWPERPYHTTNDPVLTPALLDRFFNHRTRGFAEMDDRRRMLLRSIYDLSAYAAVLPDVQRPDGVALRRHPRFTMHCPAVFEPAAESHRPPVPMSVIEISKQGFSAEMGQDIPIGLAGLLHAELGQHRRAVVKAESVRTIGRGGAWVTGFRVLTPDDAWLDCVHALETSQTHADLPPQPHGGARPEDKDPPPPRGRPVPGLPALAVPA